MFLTALLSLTALVICIEVTKYISASPKLYAIGCILTAFAAVTFILCLFPDRPKKCLVKPRVKLDNKHFKRVQCPSKVSELERLLGDSSFYFRVMFITRYNNTKYFNKHKVALEKIDTLLTKAIVEVIMDE